VACLRARPALDELALEKEDQQIGVSIVRSALANAASVAGLLLTTESIVVERAGSAGGSDGQSGFDF
jgi:chaperonin GroEL (HSP60 family)